MYGWVTYFDCCWPLVRELDLEPTYWSTQVGSNRSIHLTWPTSLCLDTLSLRSQRIVSQPLRSAATPEFWCHLTHLTVNDRSVVKQSFFGQVKVIEDTVGTAVPAHVLRLAGTFWQWLWEYCGRNQQARVSSYVRAMLSCIKTFHLRRIASYCRIAFVTHWTSPFRYRNGIQVMRERTRQIYVIHWPCSRP